LLPVLTDLPMQGTQFDQYTPWLAIDGMRQFFDVKFLDKDAKELPDDISILIVAGAHTIQDELLYEMDQFVMNGGKALIFADPLAESMALSGPAAGAVAAAGSRAGGDRTLAQCLGCDGRARTIRRQP
jgi:ABC-type uncharacterized transport system involved in gliding motility auxiliary subunit